jgi:hypothetical protein
MVVDAWSLEAGVTTVDEKDRSRCHPESRVRD